MFLPYLRLLIFLPGALLGTQIPAVIDAYEKRVDAHLLEATESFGGFQEVANRHFDGDVLALIRHHEASPDPVFRDEAESIRTLYLRFEYLTAITEKLDKGWSGRLKHLLIERDSTLLDETLSSHTYTIPLVTEALLFGLISGLALLLTAELPTRALYRFRKRKKGKKSAPTYNSSM